MSLKKLFSHYFTPHHSNNYRARLLHLDILVGVVACLSVFSLFTHTQTIKSTNVLGIATDITIQKLLELTNTKRSENGLSPLTLNSSLSDAARRKANDMLSSNYWAHNNPTTGATPWTFVKASGYSYELAGENLAKNFMFSSDVVQGWMDSKSHRDNLLKSQFIIFFDNF